MNGKLGYGQAGFDGGNGWGWRERGALVLAVTVWGGLGSLLDSFLGGWLQESVVDARTGKVVEGVGGPKAVVVVPGVGGAVSVELPLPGLETNLRRLLYDEGDVGVPLFAFSI